MRKENPIGDQKQIKFRKLGGGEDPERTSILIMEIKLVGNKKGRSRRK